MSGDKNPLDNGMGNNPNTSNSTSNYGNFISPQDAKNLVKKAVVNEPIKNPFQEMPEETNFNLLNSED